MNKEFIPYEQALELKELGFNEPCYAYYFMYENKLRHGFSNVEFDFETRNDFLEPISDNVDSPKEYAMSPTFREAFRWFREKHGLHQTVDAYFNHGNTRTLFAWNVFRNFEERIAYQLKMLEDDGVYQSESTYEEAELACLNKLIEIVKNNI